LKKPGTQGTPPDLPGLPGGTPLTPLPTTTRKYSLPVAFLPLWIPRCVPVSSHRTQDELLCGERPCGRQRFLPPIPIYYPATHKEGPDPGCINIGVPDATDGCPQTVPDG